MEDSVCPRSTKSKKMEGVETRSMMVSSTRKKTSLFNGMSPCCPVCGITIRCGEFEAHFIQEIERLSKIRTEKVTTPESRWESYQRVRANRQNRLGIRSKLKKRRHADEAICPVCCERLVGTPEELNAHAEQCLRKRDGHADEDEQVDVEGETFDAYEWDGHTRIRASSLLEGGYAGVGFQTTSSRNQKDEDDDVDLNVDGDDTATYGQAQYGEADVIPCSSDEPGEDEERQALRGALLTGSTSSQPIKVENDKWSDCYPGSPQESENDNRISSSGESYNPEASRGLDSTTGSDHVIEALKSRLREVEHSRNGTNTNQTSNTDFGLNRNKCRICMESFDGPVVSVSCWHVHCEECWLRTLGAKKLCPQCNMITSPSDLRKIYL
ncbi:hypothetical protein CHUAL_006535 [Chamberlinius hualienensis]